MERGGESQQALLAQQLEHDRQMKAIDRLHDLISQGAKALGILNGGAVVAMLAFVQALVDKPAYPAFKPYALGSLSFFLMGAFVATIVFFFHYTFINHSFEDSGRQRLWHKVVWGLLIASAACAFIGGGLITAGICVAV